MFSVEPVLNMTAVCCLLGGMFIIYQVMKNMPKGDKGKITIFRRLEVESRSLGFVVLGILLLALPIVMASRFAGAYPLTNGESRDVHDGEVEINDPDLSAFQFLRDDSVLDLRGRPDTTQLVSFHKFLPAMKPGVATYLNTMTVRKTRQATILPIVYSTSGKLSARCLTHACSIRSGRQSNKNGKHMAAWELAADVRNVKVGDQFTITVEVTYEGAFDHPEQQWFSTYSNEQDVPEVLSVTILFPEGRPFKDYKTYRNIHGSDKRQAFSGTSRVQPGNGNTTLFFEIPDAKRGESYQVAWTY